MNTASMLTLTAHMRDWLLEAGSDELFEDYCGYTAPEVVEAIEDMYPGGVYIFLVRHFWPEVPPNVFRRHAYNDE